MSPVPGGGEVIFFLKNCMAPTGNNLPIDIKNVCNDKTMHLVST
jgi:hypothetical protein